MSTATKEKRNRVLCNNLSRMFTFYCPISRCQSKEIELNYIISALWIVARTFAFPDERVWIVFLARIWRLLYVLNIFSHAKMCLEWPPSTIQRYSAHTANEIEHTIAHSSPVCISISVWLRPLTSIRAQKNCLAISDSVMKSICVAFIVEIYFFFVIISWKLIGQKSQTYRFSLIRSVRFQIKAYTLASFAVISSYAYTVRPLKSNSFFLYNDLRLLLRNTNPYYNNTIWEHVCLVCECMRCCICVSKRA